MIFNSRRLSAELRYDSAGWNKTGPVITSAAAVNSCLRIIRMPVNLTYHEISGDSTEREFVVSAYLSRIWIGIPQFAYGTRKHSCQSYVYLQPTICRYHSPPVIRCWCPHDLLHPTIDYLYMRCVLKKKTKKMKHLSLSGRGMAIELTYNRLEALKLARLEGLEILLRWMPRQLSFAFTDFLRIKNNYV